MLGEEACRLFRQIMCAVQFCHEISVLHLNLKPENIILDVSGNVKLTDFGLSTRFTAGQTLSRFWGTLLYFAPEVVRWDEYEGPQQSLGILLYLYLMLTGSRPFMANTALEVRKLIVEGTYAIHLHVSEEAQSLIHEILMVDPRQRPTLEQIMGHRG